ncbi:sensor histidine kinase [Flavobacterium sp. RHBU_3]|uniref:sensor histidine kinase n=1 Tax=Flavobacterium sp. RHBU_3 TaxID=3391184 RepID=UPI003984EAEA
MLKKAFNSLPGKLRLYAVHILLWLLLLFFPVADFIKWHEMLPVSFFVKMLFCVAIFYINYLVLVPELLLKNRGLLYVLAMVAVIALFSYIFSAYEGPSPYHLKDAVMRLRRGPAPNFGNEPPMKPRFHFFPNIVMFTLHILMSSVLKVYEEWNVSYKKQKEAETEQKTSELNFLKAQLNPHFFFNSLNTIYSLSIKKSDSTPQAVLNLADLMRYMLYETDKEKVRLTDELSYIESYIELQKLRLTPNNIVNYEVNGNPHGISVPPLLFICFIENAFKHGVNTSHGCDISIKFTITHNEIQMLVVNDINRQAFKDATPGLGIENTLKRIELYFPDSYKLNKYIEDNKFYVDLSLKI